MILLRIEIVLVFIHIKICKNEFLEVHLCQLIDSYISSECLLTFGSTFLNLQSHPATMSMVSYVYLTITVYFTRVEVLKANICKTISYHLTASLSLVITMSLEDIIVYCLLVGKYAAL